MQTFAIVAASAAIAAMLTVFDANTPSSRKGDLAAPLTGGIILNSGIYPDPANQTTYVWKGRFIKFKANYRDA